MSVTNSRPSILPVHTEAEADFGKALNIARHQNAKWLELRVGLRLSRLWLQWGRKEEARQLLTGHYSWFTEGFSTGEIQEVKLLLDELATG